MMDILMLPETKEGYKYLLTVVDLWSNELDFEPLKTKTASESLKAFKDIIKRPYLNLPKASIRTDNGGEFAKEFDAFLTEKNIKHRKSLPYRHKQMANIENLNNMLGRILMTYLTNKEVETGKEEKNWYDVTFLNNIRKELNNARKIPDRDPYDVTEAPKINFMIPKYNIGDVVIPVLDVPKNAYGAVLGNNFRRGDMHFDIKNKLKIVKVLNYPNNNRYVLNGRPNVSYAEAELMPSDKNEEYNEVKKIIGLKVNKTGTYYLVHWKGLIKAKATWELREALLSDGLREEILLFHEEQKEKEKLKRKK
jgi:hypothetical protein